MRILQITNKIPYPPNDGGAKGIMNFSRAFAELGHEVVICTLNTNKHYYPVEDIPSTITNYVRFVVQDINTDVTFFGAFLNLFSTKSYNVSRFYSKKFEHKIVEELRENQYDFVQIEGLYLMPYFKSVRDHFPGFINLRQHNVEYEIWERLYKNERNLFKRWYLKLLTKRLKRYEISQLNLADSITTVTDRDKEHLLRLGCDKPIETFQVGFFSEDVKASKVEAQLPLSVGFIGGLDWLPNREGVRWFLEQVWPLILLDEPKAVFHLAGRNMPDEFKKLKVKNTEVHGYVENADKFISAASVMISPTLSGSGMRVKLIDYLAKGKAIVSTSIGAEGIPVEDEKHISIKDSPANFARSVLDLIKDNDLRSNLERNARSFALKYYDQIQIAKDMIQFVNSQR